MTQVLSLDPRTTALVLVDLQHGIVSRPLAPHSGEQVVANGARVAAALRAKGATIVYVRVLLNDLQALPADAPMRAPNTPPAPAEASELVPQAGFDAGDLLVSKRQWGAFYGTDLDQQLRRRGIDTIVIGGIATNFGVESTARAAFDQGYKLVFVEDATTSMNEAWHRFAMDNAFPRMGHVRSSQQVIDAFA